VAAALAGTGAISFICLAYFLLDSSHSQLMQSTVWHPGRGLRLTNKFRQDWWIVPFKISHAHGACWNGWAAWASMGAASSP